MKAFTIFLLSLTGLCHAALAPFYHSTKEISDLLDDPKLVSALGVSEFVQSIHRENGKLTVRTQRCSAEVKSTITNIDRPEAPEFKYEIENIQCN